MPFKFLKSVSIITLLFVTGYTAAKYFFFIDRGRSPSSLPITKMGKEQTSQFFFDLKLKEESIATDNQQVSSIRIQLSALKQIKSGLQYQWILPEGVEVIEGELSGLVNELAAYQSLDFVIKLKSFSKQNKTHITFQIFGDSELGPVKRQVLVSSRSEDTFEYQIQKNYLSTSENQINKLDIHRNKFSAQNVVR